MNDEILHRIIQTVKAVDVEYIDEYLDLRDKDPFDENWITAYETIERHVNEGDLTFQNQEKALREQVFKEVANLTQHYELAEYLSDDAGLIFTNHYFNFGNEFVNRLFDNYKSDKLPH